MRFYNQQHKHYCGIDLHARKMYVCILNNKGKVLVHQNIKTDAVFAKASPCQAGTNESFVKKSDSKTERFIHYF